jgi:hypothetical protein
MGYRQKTFTQQTLTDAGTVTLNPDDNIDENVLHPEFEGVVSFVVTANEVSGTLDGDCQLQGSHDGTNWVNIGSTVAIVDTKSVIVPLGDTTLYYSYYQTVITGVGTQSTTIDATYTRKSNTKGV